MIKKISCKVCSVFIVLLLILSPFIPFHDNPYAVAIEKASDFGSLDKSNISMLSGSVSRFLFTETIRVELKINLINSNKSVSASVTRYPFVGAILKCYSAARQFDCAT